MDEECWFCDPEARVEQPPGGWLVDDDTWLAGHAPAAHSIAGTVILEARRHVLDQSVFDDNESSSIGPVTGRLVGAIRDASGCDRVYQWSTMDRFAHFHTWLIPWWASCERRGPRHLVDVTIDNPGCSEDEAVAMAGRIGAALAR